MDTNLKDKKEQANRLRKLGDFQNARDIYTELWEVTKDKFDGAGLLHCLRKLQLFDEAIKLADELVELYSDFNWCKNEVVWTYIEGKLVSLRNNMNEFLIWAKKTLELNPEGIARQKIIFFVLKVAKENNRWDVITNWIDLINPDALTSEPIIHSPGKDSWSYLELWYNYKLNCLIKAGQYHTAVEMVDWISEKINTNHVKFFMRLKALSYYKSGDLIKAEDSYKILCSRPKNDWWLVYEYAKVVRDTGRHVDALGLMYKAAASSSRTDGMVSMMLDIAHLCTSLGRHDEADAHFMLFIAIRKKNAWRITDSLSSIYDNIVQKTGRELTFKELLRVCRSYWGCNNDNGKVKSSNRIRGSLVGTVYLGREDAGFCFIRADNESFFCHKSALPIATTDGSKVKFDAFLSFDKKKSRDSWKAKNISLI